MPAKHIEGKTLADSVFDELKERVAALQSPPALSILASEHSAESAYIRAKRHAGERIGVTVRIVPFPDDTSATTLSEQVNDIARATSVDGVVVQLPLPKHLDVNRNGILRIIPEERDVDCLSERWLGRLVSGRTNVQLKRNAVALLPPVVGAIQHMLEVEQVSVSGKRVVVVGWGDLVGKPVALWMLSQGATVTVATKQEEHLEQLTAGADIIVLGAGRPGLLRSDMVREGVIVLDAGTSDDGGTLRGDAEPSVADKAVLMTPVPGGIGPLTVAMLYKNLVALAEGRQA